MKIYLAHSSGYDYKSELYEPIKTAFANEYEIFYPHDSHADGVISKDFIPRFDAIIAEVSLPSTGQGIELGWASFHDKPIICFYKTGSNPSNALRFISQGIFEYATTGEMIKGLRSEIQRLA